MNARAPKNEKALEGKVQREKRRFERSCQNIPDGRWYAVNNPWDFDPERLSGKRKRRYKRAVSRMSRCYTAYMNAAAASVEYTHDS